MCQSERMRMSVRQWYKSDGRAEGLAPLNTDNRSFTARQIGMPKRRSGKSNRNEFDLSVDEGTFDDYETFGIYSDDAAEGSLPEYEIFIVSTGHEI